MLALTSTGVSHISQPTTLRGCLMRKRGWTMPEDEARSLLVMIEERIRSSEIEVRHRDMLIRLRATIEEDLASDATSRSVVEQQREQNAA